MIFITKHVHLLGIYMDLKVNIFTFPLSIAKNVLNLQKQTIMLI